MSEDLYYDRDNNLSGISSITFSDYTPVYGSRVTFVSTSHSYETKDNYFNTIPLSLNSLSAKFQVRYDVNSSDAQKLANFIESKSGVNQFEFAPDTSVYQNISGYCNSYAVNHINEQHYEVAIEVDIEQSPCLLNWSGMNFTSYNFSGWVTGQNYNKYDIIYNPTSSNKLNNFYYCTGDHSSSSASVDGPTGSSSMWTQEFFFEPDIGFQNEVSMKIDKTEFKNSTQQRIKTSKNIAAFPVSYKYSNITTQQLVCMLHFLENKAGYRRFKHQIPSIYNRPKVYFCPEWTHTWNYYDSHTLDVSLIEDALGVIPTGT